MQDADGDPFEEKEGSARLRQIHRKDLARRSMAAPGPERQSGRSQPGQRLQVRPKVHFDNDASQIATVVEVECLDRPGCCYDMTQAMFESGLSISTSMIATYGERAVDVFYVRDGFGHKVTHPDRLAAVERASCKALAEPRRGRTRSRINPAI